MQIQQVAFTNSSVQITYIEEADVHSDSGIIKASTLDIPHECIPNALFAELQEAIHDVIEQARVTMRKPVDTFTATR